MYDFAVVALLGLATLKVVDLLTDLVPATSRFRGLAIMVVAVAGVALIDYSVFAGFGIEVRDAWLGSLFTGLVAGALASVWASVIGWLGGDTTARPESSTVRGAGRPRVAA